MRLFLFLKMLSLAKFEVFVSSSNVDFSLVTCHILEAYEKPIPYEHSSHSSCQ